MAHPRARPPANRAWSAGAPRQQQVGLLSAASAHERPGGVRRGRRIRPDPDAPCRCEWARAWLGDRLQKESYFRVALAIDNGLLGTSTSVGLGVAETSPKIAAETKHMTMPVDTASMTCIPRPQSQPQHFARLTMFRAEMSPPAKS